VQVEDFTECFYENPHLGTGCGLQRADRHVHDLVDDPVGESVNRQLLFGRKLAEATAHAIKFCLTNGLELILQRNDRRNYMKRLQTRMESLDLGLNNVFGVLGFLPAALDV